MAIVSRLLAGPDPEYRHRARSRGPLLGCEVAVAADDEERRRVAGLGVPAPVGGHLLLDSGASTTCIDERVLHELGIATVRPVWLNTAAGLRRTVAFPCRISFPGTHLTTFARWRVLAIDVARQGIIGVLGRDYLARCLLVYDGPAGIWSIAT